MILVTGATGTTGGAVLDALLAEGAPVRGLVRSAEAAEAIRARGAEAVVGDLADPTSLIPAFRGVERFLLVTPPGPEQAELETNAIAVGEQGGAYAVVKIGCLGEAATTLPTASAHAEVLDAIQATSLRWTLLQPSTYMQGYLPAMREGRLVSGAAGARVAPVDARDVAEVAARALTQQGHEACSYVLTGPEALDERKIAELLGIALVEAGAEGAARTGGAEAVTPDVEAVLGRPPRSLSRFAGDHRAID